MPRRYRFRQVDVFTDTPFQGNPLAVFPDAEGLTDDEMQALAREMNISETCYVLAPSEAGRRAGAAYRLRIFTPGVELPFAGHPSIGAAWVLADEGRFPLIAPRTDVKAEIAIGVLPISLAVGEDSRIGAVTMTQGHAERTHELDDEEVAELCEALEVGRDAIGWPSAGGGRRRGNRVAPAVISTGLPHLVVPFVDRALLMDVDHERRAYVSEICQSLDCDSAALVAPGNSGTIADADVSVRMFDAGSLRIDADPATGAAAGPIAVFLGAQARVRGRGHRVVIEQGTELGRPSRLVAEVDFGGDGTPTEVRVSGGAVAVLDGWVTLP